MIDEVEALARARKDLVCARQPLVYRAGRFDLLSLRSRTISPTDKIVLIQAGIHGDEVAGPLTFLHHFDRVIDAVHSRGLKLVAFPLANPSGFAAGTRYNIDGDRGEDGNADFLRYELDDGRLRGDLGAGSDFVRWHWSSDLPLHLPVETRALHEQLRALPVDQVRAVIDLHQDRLTPDLPAAAYHYVLRDPARFAAIVDALPVPVLARRALAAGYGAIPDADGKVRNAPDPARALVSDERGFIVRHDGTLCDLFGRLGAEFCVTVETTGATPLELACAVNLAWIEGIAALV